MKATIVMGRPCMIVPGRDEFGDETNTEHMLSIEDVARLRWELGDILLKLEQERKAKGPAETEEDHFCPIRAALKDAEEG